MHKNPRKEHESYAAGETGTTGQLYKPIMGAGIRFTGIREATDALP